MKALRRQDAHKKKRLAASWRKPRGLHSKARLGKRGYAAAPSPGRRSPKAERSLVKGSAVVRVASPAELASLAKEKGVGVVIAAGVGARKREEIIKAAVAAGVTLLNVRDPAAELRRLEERLAKRKAAVAARSEKRKEREKESRKPVEERLAEEPVKSEEERRREEAAEKERILTKKS